jgi:predicted transcriptional regulator of viral defense system
MSGVANYITRCLQYEEYSFTWEELKAGTSKTDTALRNELSRLVKKGDLINLRKGFYLILPPRFKNYQKLPVELYCEKLFQYLNKPYYISLYSAAAFYGASHQQIQKDYLITRIPNIRDIKKGAIMLKMFATSNWPKKNILQKKADAGYFHISSPSLTAIDLIHYQTKLGGLNRMLAVIEELIEEITIEDFKDLIKWYPHVSSLQRFGLLLEKYNADDALLNTLITNLEKRKFYPVLLSPELNRKPGSTMNKWKVDMSIEMESDL